MRPNVVLINCDEATGLVGNDVPPVGRVAKSHKLIRFDPDHPYYLAEYDLLRPAESGRQVGGAVPLDDGLTR